MKPGRPMRSLRPAVRALLMTTAVAWSINARLPDADPPAPVEWSGETQRQSGTTILPFRRGAPAPASSQTGESGDPRR